MPRNHHYRQAMHLLDDVHGADACDEVTAYRQTVEQIAKLFEVSESYQSHLSSDVPANQKPQNPSGAKAA